MVDDEETNASAGDMWVIYFLETVGEDRTGATSTRDGEPVRSSGPRRGTQEGARAACVE